MCKPKDEGGRCAYHTGEDWRAAADRNENAQESARNAAGYAAQTAAKAGPDSPWSPEADEADRARHAMLRAQFTAEVAERDEYAALVEYAGTPAGRADCVDRHRQAFYGQDRDRFARAMAEADDRKRFADESTVKTRTAPDVSGMSRSEFTKSIRQVLKARSGKQWSVTGGSGTSYGWVNVSAPKSRLNEHGHMTEEDQAELGHLLGHDRPVHSQGDSYGARGDYWQELANRAHTGHTNVVGQQYWD